MTTQQKATAQLLYDRALALMETGQALEACPLLEQSQAIDPGAGTLMYLGECYRRTNRPASAWVTFLEASSTARETGQVDRAQRAQAVAAELEPLSPRVTLVLTPGTPSNVELWLDAAPLAPAVLQTQLPLDPGMHELRMSLPGFRTETIAFSVGGPGSVQSVQLPALWQISPLPVLEAPAPPAPEARPLLSRSAVTTSLAVLGAGGFGLGVLFGLQALNLDAEARRECDSPRCSDAAIRASKVANVSYVVGALSSLGAAALYVTRPTGDGAQSTSAATGSGWQLGVGLDSGGTRLFVVEGAL